MVPASPLHVVNRSQLHQSQDPEEFSAIPGGGLLQSTLHTEQGIYKKHTGKLAQLELLNSSKTIGHTYTVL